MPTNKPLPNGIQLDKLAELLSYSDTYQITIQFWPGQIVVYIEKNEVPLAEFGSDFDTGVVRALDYLKRINHQS